QVLVVLSQNIINGSVPVGESLTALDPSKSPVHALGFSKIRAIQPNGGFSLSIWFYKTPNTTIVWHAQDVNTTSGLVPAGSKVTLTADRGLVLADPRDFHDRVPAATTKSLDVGRNLSSRRTETDFGKGKFRLHLGLDGNLQLLVLNSNSLSDSDVYFHYYESRTKEPNPGTRLVFNRSGYMYVLLSSKQQLNAYSQQGSSRVFYRLLPPCRSTFRRCFN
ncbi:unnamed protein product, partial [Brassica napus]